MRKIFCLFVVLLLPAIFFQAQTVTSKSFNEIKRSKQYFYYDITMESEDEAKNAANINLAKLINDYCVEKSITNVKVKDTDLKDVQYLKMDRNGMVRILAYVEKSVYIGKNEDASVKPKSTVVAVRKVEQKHQTVSNADLISPQVETVVIPSRNIPSPEAASLSQNSSVISLEKWQQAVVEELCHITSAEKLMMRLSELQNQYKVKRFGLRNECRNDSECFWVIYDSGKNVTAILSPGSDMRYNYYKGISEKLDTYLSQGLNAIWFQLSK